MAEILILGAGGFGTALAIMCAQNGHDVTLYSPFQEEIETLSAAREHKKLLPGVKIPETVKMVWELPQTVSAPVGGRGDAVVRCARRLRVHQGTHRP